jgi:hypothetical protein
MITAIDIHTKYLAADQAAASLTSMPIFGAANAGGDESALALGYAS